MGSIVETKRMSIGVVQRQHDVDYSPTGMAYCKREKSHQWKYGDEHWDNRSKKGYIAFGDRHLGMGVEHRIKVYQGEDYVAFWTRIREAEKRGYIEVMGTSAYSSKDVNILAQAGMGNVVKTEIEEGALIGGLTPGEEKAWLATNKQDTDVPGIISKSSQKIAGIGVIGIAAVVAIGYLIMMGGKKK